MSDILLNKAMNVNANAQTEHADVSAAGSSDAALGASEGGLSYSGTTGADASYAVHPPELPEVPEVAGLQQTADAAVADATSHVGAPELPELPLEGSVGGELAGDAGAAVEGTSAGLDVALAGWLDVMGAALAELTGGLTAFLGL